MMHTIGRGISRERFEQIRRAWGAVGSWAVWADAVPDAGVKSGIGDLSVLDPESNPGLLATLTPDVVMLGINCSEFAGEPFGNFHDPSPRANHFKLRHAYRGTPFWGAYLTDAFKGIPAYGAARTVAYLRERPGLVAEQLDDLRRELAEVGGDDPLLVVFGAGLFRLLREHLTGFQMARVPHYAHFLSKKEYRDQALRAIDEQVIAGTART